MNPNQDSTPPTQAEIEALSRELMSRVFLPDGEEGDICRRAALMIARLELAYLQERRVVERADAYLLEALRSR